ncbi:MAG: SpoIID/LytB domain-containing protein [Eubacteriales bacterium]|nr:SpoIID/LytB domain-containing protein [Eubacteriales bacterium]
MLATLTALLSGCAAGINEPSVSPEGVISLPEGVETADDGSAIIRVYISESGTIEEMSLEEYLPGVVAGEMNPSWPQEALRAQAILARTYTLKFISEKKSAHEGADISTDIKEAQAYAPDRINDNVKKAVSSTKGIVLISSENELINAWFHAHSGGKTAMAKEGLNFSGDEPEYITSVSGMENDEADIAAAEWTADFSAHELQSILSDMGIGSIDVHSFTILEKGTSGRATVFSINGSEVNAAEFRIAAGSTKMRSTLLSALFLTDGGGVTMSGKGYGHGVGMSQWGAYAQAQSGKKGEEIAEYYFTTVKTARIE